jgi:phosphohistidine phosphatase
MAPILGDPPVDFLEPLYGAGPREVIRMVRGHDGPGPLMVIGHNPTVQHVSLMLTGAGSAESRARLGAKFPTAALAVIDFDGSGWDGVAPEAGSLARFIRPKDVDVAAEREL